MTKNEALNWYRNALRWLHGLKEDVPTEVIAYRSGIVLSFWRGLDGEVERVTLRQPLGCSGDDIDRSRYDIEDRTPCREVKAEPAQFIKGCLVQTWTVQPNLDTERGAALHTPPQPPPINQDQWRISMPNQLSKQVSA